MALRSSPAPFLIKTYQLVDDEASNDVVSWSDDGGTFVVWKTAEFAKDLLPNYFKHNNFSSFVRQLNTYGFKKIVPDKWEFSNEYFKKGKNELLCRIRRRKTSLRENAKATMISNSGEDLATISTSSSEPKSPFSSTEKSPGDISGENEKLKEVNKNLSSQLVETKRQCEELMTFLTECVKVQPNEIGKILRQGSYGSTGPAPAITVQSEDDDDVIEDEEEEEEGGLKLFGVWLKGKKKRGRDEEMGDRRKEMKKVAPWMMMMTIGSTLSAETSKV